jgi:hypothetical protein
MFTKIYTMKFPTLNDAKIAVSFLSEEIGGSIASFNISGVNILLDKEGMITITVRFDSLEEMQAFSKRKTDSLENLRKSFPVRLTEQTTVAVFTFNREAAATV